MECQLDPRELGWRLDRSKLVPIMTDQVPALEEPLCIFRLDAIVKLLQRIHVMVTNAHAEITVLQ